MRHPAVCRTEEPDALSRSTLSWLPPGKLRKTRRERQKGARERIVNQGRWLQRVAAIQGVFYILTGLWPLLDIASFQAATGPKVELWLVRTVGVLVIVIGGVLVAAARHNNIGFEITLLAGGSALGLAGIDVFYALSRTIPRIYLLDAVVELGFVGGWILGRRRA
jgi:hypothetical protein